MLESLSLLAIRPNTTCRCNPPSVTGNRLSSRSVSNVVRQRSSLKRVVICFRQVGMGKSPWNTESSNG